MTHVVDAEDAFHQFDGSGRQPDDSSHQIDGFGRQSDDFSHAFHDEVARRPQQAIPHGRVRTAPVHLGSVAGADASRFSRRRYSPVHRSARARS
jgi:hypothetical protein